MSGRWIDRWILGANLSLIAVILLATLLVPASSYVAVIMPPGSTREETAIAIASAGGSFIAPSRFDWIMIAHSDAADFSERLRMHGAWFILNHKVISGCFSSG